MSDYDVNVLMTCVFSAVFAIFLINIAVIGIQAEIGMRKEEKRWEERRRTEGR